ncbi:MAG: hypothetical protein JJ975_12125, partial [Bacteroidia bacterium]|nr:hypothetical protein [Bacteroidia bacterium]
MKKTIKTHIKNSPNRNWFKLIAVALLCAASFTTVHAGIEPEIDRPMDCDTASVGDTVVTRDIMSFKESGHFIDGYNSLGYVEYGIKNTAYVRLIETLDSCFLDTFSIWVDLEITSKDRDSVSYTDTVRLKVSYHASMEENNNSIASFVYENRLWSQAKILGFSDTTLKRFVRIGQTMNIERYRDLSVSSVPDFGSVQVVSGTDEVKFSWDSVPGAEFYELEWTWVDAFDNSGSGSLLSASNVEVEFRNNSTNVTVSDLYYSISPSYESGYLVARVRAVGVNKYKPDQPVFSNWSDQTYNSLLSSYTSGQEYIQLKSSTSYVPLDEGMNWQYAATFAEYGKRKEVISYYDGSLRTRQSVTRISTNMQAIVGETIYDYEGRPAVNILPVPAFDQSLKFHPAFNLSQVTGNSYNRNDFDSLSGSLCSIVAASLKNTSGASNYYSDENDSASSRDFGFIPDASGHPMTITEYMADGTGRIKRQGGVGEDHQLGTGHETKYYYSTPGNQELDRLFGNAVGSVEHYQKEMVVDPNGQVSVSYKDLSGKVIATSLAGNSPDS